MTRRTAVITPAAPVVRCAIYTRKSSDEGLEQAFNSLNAQRERCEDAIRSHAGQGWICLAEHFDDGGYTGGNTDRPALKRLLAWIESGSIDCVVVYRVDRLSRSLLDFARLMEMFERHKVSFVSVTESFNTATSTGRLQLNMTLAFAQHEREVASERTRDKIAAARKKGKWSGGPPILGYDILPEAGGSRLVVNAVEAEQVRRIYVLYLELGSLLSVVKRLDDLGWTTKRWTAKSGATRGGAPFTKTRLHHLLTNVAYLGKVRHHDQVYPGEHDAIITTAIWTRVQAQLAKHARSGGTEVRNKMGALLKGLVRCAQCDCAMSAVYTSKRGRQWRYYVCNQATNRGWHVCPTKSVPAADLERFVVNEIKVIGKDPALVAEVIDAANHRITDRMREIDSERAVAERDLARAQKDIRSAKEPGHLADLHERIAAGGRRIAALDDEASHLRGEFVHEHEVREALAEFDAVWSMLSPREQWRVMQSLIDTVEVDKPRGVVRIMFKPSGLQTLAGDRSHRAKADAA